MWTRLKFTDHTLVYYANQNDTKRICPDDCTNIQQIWRIFAGLFINLLINSALSCAKRQCFYPEELILWRLHDCVFFCQNDFVCGSTGWCGQSKPDFWSEHNDIFRRIPEYNWVSEGVPFVFGLRHSMTGSSIDIEINGVGNFLEYSLYGQLKILPSFGGKYIKQKRNLRHIIPSFGVPLFCGPTK